MITGGMPGMTTGQTDEAHEVWLKAPEKPRKGTKLLFQESRMNR